MFQNTLTFMYADCRFYYCVWPSGYVTFRIGVIVQKEFPLCVGGSDLLNISSYDKPE